MKVDGVEKYTLESIIQLRNCYEEFLENSEGTDPDFPMSNFGGKKGKKVGGRNIHSIFEEDDPRHDKLLKERGIK